MNSVIKMLNYNRILLLLCAVLSCPIVFAQISQRDSLYIDSLNVEAQALQVVQPKLAIGLVEEALQFCAEQGYELEYAYEEYVLATIYKYTNEVEKSDSLVRQALLHLHPFEHSLYASMCYLLLGTNAITTFDLDSAEVYLQQSLALKEAVDDEYGVGFVYQSLGILEDYRGNYNDAIEHYQASLEIMKKYENMEMISNNWNNISILWHALGELTRAIEAQHKAVAINEEIGFVQNLPMNYVCLATYHLELDSLTKASIYGELALAMSEEVGNEQAHIYALACMGDVKMKSGEDQEAAAYFSTFMKEVDESVSPFEQNTVKIKLAELSIKLKDYEEAKAYAESALTYFTRQEAKKEVLDITVLLGELSAKRGKYREAYQYATTASSLREEVASALIKRDFLVKEANYQNKIQRDSIEILSLSEQAARTAAKQQRWLGYTYLTGIVFLAILLYVIFRYYREEQKNSAFLEDQNTKLIDINSQLQQDVFAAKTYEDPQQFLSNSFLELSNKTKTSIKLFHILYLESKDKGIYIYTDEGEEYKDWQTLKAFEALLPEALFVRIHRSYIINIHQVRENTIKTVELSNGTELPISRSYREQAMKILALRKVNAEANS